MAALGFFNSEETLTPESIERRRKLAEMLMQQGMTEEPIRHWTQGAARLMKSASGAYMDKRLNDADKSNRDYANQLLAGLLGGQGPSAPSAMPPSMAPQSGSGPMPPQASPAPQSPMGGGMPPMPPQRPQAPAGAPAWAGAMPSAMPTGSLDQSGSMPPAPAQTAFAPPQSLIQSESGGNWQAQNNARGAGGMPGHFGRLQFGQARLQDAMRAGVIPPGTTPQQFMASPELQQAAERWHFADIDRAIQSGPAAQAIGQAIGGVPVTQEGLRAVAHLGGTGGMNKFVQSGGQYNPADANGTTLMAYLQRHGGQGAPQAAQAPQGQQMAQASPIPAPTPTGGVGQAMGSNNQQAIARFLMDPRVPQNMKASVMPVLQSMMGAKVQYQTDGAGNIIALDPQGIRPPQIVHRGDSKPIMVGEGQTAMVPDPSAPSGYRTIATGGDKGTPDQKNYEAAVKGGFKGTFSDYQVMLKRAGSAQPESSFNVEMAKGQAKGFTELAGEFPAAKSDIANIKMLREQMDKLPGGFLGNAQAMAVRLGIKLGEGASAIEAADAILNRLTPAQRQGMPGAASDRDVAMFKGALPTLGQTKEGSKIILDTMQGLAQYKLKQAEIAQQVAMGRLKPEQALEMLSNIPDPFEQFKAIQGAQPQAKPASGKVRTISREEYQSLPSGSQFIAADDPTQTVRVKP